MLLLGCLSCCGEKEFISNGGPAPNDVHTTPNHKLSIAQSENSSVPSIACRGSKVTYESQTRSNISSDAYTS